jgi:hypothetical protein
MVKRFPILSLGSLILLVSLVLSSLGLAYGLWSESLQINGTVTTGHLDGEWIDVHCYETESKQVADTTAWIDNNDPTNLYFQIANGYPGYFGGCEVEYQNTGTIPVHVEAINFIPGTLTNCTVNQSQNTGSFTATCDQVKIVWADGLCTQLHPGDFHGGSLKVTVLQNAQMATTYTFGVQVQLNQYNESSCP